MRTSKAPALFKRPLFLSLCLVATLFVVVAILELTNVTHFFHHTNATTANPENKGVVADLQHHRNAVTSDNTNTASEAKGDAPVGESSGQAQLIAPSGVFVSNHSPNLSGSPAPNQISSVCNTTAGANCTIVFTKSGATRSLPVKKTDSGGAAYWTWKLQDIGLTVGTWHVQAVATLGGQTQKTADLRDLVVAE